MNKIENVNSIPFPGKRFRKWPIIFLCMTMLGLSNFGIVVGELMVSGKTFSLRYPLVHELTGAWCMFLLLPLMLYLMNGYPVRRSNWIIAVPVHLAASAVFGATHTMMIWGSRRVIYWVGDMGPFDFGRMDYRFLMEYQKQLISYLTVYGLAALARYIVKNREKELKTARLEQQLVKTRLQTLQMQLNPHFLFNTLNMISSTMYESVAAADKMIAYLSDLLRLTLKSGSGEEYSLKEELETLHLYIEIMKARFKDRLDVEIAIEKDLMEAAVPRFILQPLVENSIKFGMENLENIKVTLSAAKKGSRLLLEVKDNGPGIRGEGAINTGGGVGIANTEERLQKLYGTEHAFSLQNMEKGGVCAALEIPLRQYKAPANGSQRPTKKVKNNGALPND